MRYLVVASVVVVVLALVKTGSALQCWTCDSEMDVLCNDHFNTTEMYKSYNYATRQFPTLQQCTEGGNSYLHAQKPVCVKKKQSFSGSSRILTIRQCMYVPLDTRSGTCPPSTTGASHSVDFCEICEYDGCNGANSINLSVLAAVLPVAVALWLRK